MSANIISIRDLYKEYSSVSGAPFVALNKVNIDVPQGSFYGLLGPNGAGKSTLINILSGVVNKTSGKCIVDGYDLDQDPTKVKLALGVVPQEVVFDPFFTVRQTLDNYAGYFGVPKSLRRTDEIIAALSLTDKADVPSRSLSGGMKRRMLIAKALVHSPKILILDEPTAGVDIELREQLWNYIKKLNAAGTTIILTTHYIEEAENLCSHIAVINSGKIVASNKKADLLGLLQEKTVEIKFIENIDGLASSFTMPNVKIEGDKITLRYCDHQTLTQFIQAVSSIKIGICDIDSRGVSLEEVLKLLIKNDGELYARPQA